MPIPETIDQANLDWIHGILRIAGRSDIGLVRSVNQDAYTYLHLPHRGEALLVVADGLGGHRGGEIASRIAAEVIVKRIVERDDDPARRLRAAIAAANLGILDAAREDPALQGMGTTVVCLLIAQDGRSHVAHVGDSRLYRLRGTRIESITDDHSLVATLLREGVLTADEARDDPRRNQVLRALGVREQLDIDVAPIETLPRDLYLLCSDGLHGLIEAANAAGGSDNVTCLLAQLPEPTLFPQLRAGASRWFARVRSRLPEALRP